MRPPLPLDVEYSVRRQLPFLGFFVLLLLALGALWKAEILPGWLATATGSVLAVVLVVGGVEAALSARSGVVLTIDQHGLIVRQSHRIPWSDLKEVVIGPLQPAWLFGSRFVQVVAFVPQPGVDLPDPPSASGNAYTFGRRARLRRYGTNLVINATATNARPEEFAGAAEASGNVPVQRVKGRGQRGWLAIVGVAMVIGLVAGVVAGLSG